MNEKKSFGYYVGKAMALVLVSCLAICACAAAVALTANFILWLI